MFFITLYFLFNCFIAGTVYARAEVYEESVFDRCLFTSLSLLFGCFLSLYISIIEPLIDKLKKRP